MMVSDQKITSDDPNAKPEWEPKLEMVGPGLVVGGSGDDAMCRTFLYDLRKWIELHPEADYDAMVREAAQIIRRNNLEEGQKGYVEIEEVLIGHPSVDAGLIWHINHVGRRNPVTKYKLIGTGATVADVFFRKLWSPEMDPLEVMYLGAFCIGFIEEYGFDARVGVGKQTPVAYLIPRMERSIYVQYPKDLDQGATTKGHVKDFAQYLSGIKQAINGQRKPNG